MTPLFKAPALIGRLSNTFETVLRQSPGLLEFPSGTLNSEFTQVNEIYDGLSKIKRYYQANVTTALNIVQSSFPAFPAFSFDAEQSSLQVQTNDMPIALQSFIISSCLSRNDIIITLARDTNRHALATNGSLTTDSLVSCEDYDQYGVCSTWWYDASTNSAYDPQKNCYDLLQQLFSNDWTTPSLLFAGVLDYAEYVKRMGMTNQPTLDLETMQPQCISNTQICVYDPTCSINDPKCESQGYTVAGSCGGPSMAT
ncbi:MAG: hypothetical protein Q9181_005160 [Wetmoreana brouardii]